MKELEQKIKELKLKRAALLSQAEMLSTVSDLLYRNIGKVEVEIHFAEKELNKMNRDSFEKSMS